MRAPSFWYLSGWRRKSTTSTSSFSASSMPATSSKVTVCVSASTRLARERPNWPSTPPPAPAEAARRNSKMNSATSRIVGPKLNRIVSSSERLPGGFALTTTSCSSSRFASCSSSAKVGTSVSKRLALLVLVVDVLLELALERLAGRRDLLDVAVRAPGSGRSACRARGSPSRPARRSARAPS